MSKIKYRKILLALPLIFLLVSQVEAQQNFATHTRGKLWETLYNWGYIGDPGFWDYTEITGIGFFPGFAGYDYPDDELKANGYITDANFHNARSGPWIIAKDAITLIPPGYTPQHKDFLFFHSSMATLTDDYGIVSGDIMPFKRTENYSNKPGFNPLLPEEMNYVEWATTTGITVKQRTMSWSFPGYNDFIIYDYVFKNTGDLAIPSAGVIKHYEQTLNEVWFAFHSELAVSTKGMLNFHYNPIFQNSAAPAGGFGWHPGSGYSDYWVVQNDQSDGEGLFFYSRDYNGGREPVPGDKYGLKPNWQDQLRKVSGMPPELQDPSGFGFTFLYRTTPSGGDPNDPDPTHFSIYSDEAEKFGVKTVDTQSFGPAVFSYGQIYDFMKTDHRVSNTGDLYCMYTGSYGPYTLAPGDSVRIIVAEVAGTLDLHEVYRGDPDHMLKSFTEDYMNDSVAADMHRNIQAVRNAFKWGFGAKVNGIDLAADVPDSPPSPNCKAINSSYGGDTAIIAVQWDKLAEGVQYTDGSSQIFFDGATDLSGYRIYRGVDKRGIWDLVADIPRSDFNKYWDVQLNEYSYKDYTVQFGYDYYYYVQAYYANPRPWTSANGTIVNDLPELTSGDYNRTPLTSAKPGPVDLTKEGWDVFVAPNPYIEGDPEHSFPSAYKIEFRKLPEKATINIYSISGDLIKVLHHAPDSYGNLAGSIAWDQRSDSGLLVAPGLYIYVVQSETEGTKGERTTGKLMIIR